MSPKIVNDQIEALFGLAEECQNLLTAQEVLNLLQMYDKDKSVVGNLEAENAFSQKIQKAAMRSVFPNNSKPDQH